VALAPIEAHHALGIAALRVPKIGSGAASIIMQVARWVE